MKVLQINTGVNTGSTGRIAEEIGQTVMDAGHTSYIAYGRPGGKSQSHTIKIGSSFDYKWHGLQTRIFDNHAFASLAATKKFIAAVDRINPDIIHLHNLHGYYIHAGLLFSFLKERKRPVIWTLHDCWAFTGHCCYFDFVKCEKWKTHCNRCPLKTRYPESFVFDNSANNFTRKRTAFTGVDNLTLVTPSKWLKNLLPASFLHQYPVSVIHNGVSLQTFRVLKEQDISIKKKLGISNEKVILGVASIWDRRKGLQDFIELSKQLQPDDKIILLGLTTEQQKGLPENIIALQRTESLEQMVELYNLATVFVNPTWVDNFPTTNIEALACGTPVITYNTGGSVEAIDEHTGYVIGQGDIAGLAAAIQNIKQKGKDFFSGNCRSRAVQFFNNKERFSDYVHLYENTLGIKS